jgi:hypothetical protein
MLQNSLTVYDYLCRGISLYSMLITGQRFRLSKHEEEFRFNVETIGDHGIGAYQSHVESLCVTIARLRQAAGPDWSPREISFAYRSREDLPAMDLFAGSRILRGTGKTYFTIPPELMQMRFPRSCEDIPVSRPEFSARGPFTGKPERPGPTAD